MLQELGFHKTAGAQADLYKQLKPIILGIRNSRSGGELSANMSIIQNVIKQKPHLRRGPRQKLYNGTSYSFRTPGNTKKYQEAKIMENFMHNPQFGAEHLGLIQNLKRSKKLTSGYVKTIEHGQKKWWE